MSLKETLALIENIANKYLIDKPYLVGGVPRDIYLEIPSIQTTDLDITTNSTEVLRLGILIADHLNVTFELSEDGHITVFSDEFDIDFSSHFISPKVVDYLDNKFAGLEEAFSRDFTINTLHQDLITNKITDPTGKGFDDIKNKLIRTPVPCEITLSDDPRRAYRAVNLAARYGFEIDEEIKAFTRDNPGLFLTEKIKDKYIAVKMSKALKQNPDLTIKLLKEMNLFSNVPLTGMFKDILIERKMLIEYLNSQVNAGMVKSAVMIARDWNEYVAQGPAYQLIKDWWTSNYSKMPGDKNLTYNSWVNWYTNKYNSEWNRVHKDPEETLQIMQSEAGRSSPDQEKEFVDRKQKLLSLLNPFKSVQEKTTKTEEKTKNKSIFKRKNNDGGRTPDRARDYTSIEGGKVYIKPGVNIQNVTSAVKNFIKELGDVAEQLNVETPIITSAWRSIESQSKIMGKNWKNNGGMNGGRQYLEQLYGKEYGGQMASIFEAHGTTQKGTELGAAIIGQRTTGSNHISNPGKALDLSLTNGIKDVLDAIQLNGKFNFKVLDETRYAGPHYHVSIHGENLEKTAIFNRIKKIKNIQTTNS